MEFQSTLSLRRATSPARRPPRPSIFQSTLSLRRATGHFPAKGPHSYDFNPRSPCGERPQFPGLGLRVLEFQSTLSLRRATEISGCVKGRILNFNPRSPCGERPVDARGNQRLRNFNPRSPCGERLPAMTIRLPPQRFQSTLSLRRATGHAPEIHRRGHRFQSTLSLRRATILAHALPPQLQDFNPRSPCGERHGLGHLPYAEMAFQSTLSLRRATTKNSRFHSWRCISIHALLAESDSWTDTRSILRPKFQSTLSLRRATGWR